MKITALSFATLLPSITMAHPGHVPDESVHHLLHAEYLVIIVSAGLIAFAIEILRRK